MEDILDTFLLKPQTRDELVITAQRDLILQIHACHNGVDTFLVHFSKRQSTLLQKQVACMLSIVEIVCIVDNALDVTFVVAHLHTGFKNVFIHIIIVMSL